MSTNIKRRNFLKKSLLATSGIILAPNFISCKEEGDNIASSIPSNLKQSNFTSGVASFDPTNSSVIIWTRYTSNKTLVSIVYEVATDIEFKNLVRQNQVVTDASRDYTVAIEVQDLNPNQKLYYRFINIEDATVSVVGETVTFGDATQKLKMAVASCANYAYGYFNVYEAISNSDAEVVVHLGDYIYEYEDGAYGNFRKVAPGKEIITLDDYRERYRQYRSDKQLMELHRKKPFICVWDDHEVTDNSYKSGAANHQSATEGDYEVRKSNALQAYSEYLPNSTNIIDDKVIYRNLKLGNLVDLIMLDTRIIGRDKQLSYADYFTENGAFDVVTFQKDLLNPNRTMLGETQRNWLLQQVEKSTSNWQIIGQQVLMGKMLIPVELLSLLNRIRQETSKYGSAKQETFLAFQKAVNELVVLKTRFLNNDPSLTLEEISRIKTVLPYNLDAWDGYFMERETVLASFEGKQVAVLAGDTHNAWQSDLTNASGVKVGLELATSSVSSPGLEVYLSNGASLMEKALTLLIDDLNYLNATQRGFMKVTVYPGNIKSEWNFVDSIQSETYSLSLAHTFSYS